MHLSHLHVSSLKKAIEGVLTKNVWATCNIGTISYFLPAYIALDPVRHGATFKVGGKMWKEKKKNCSAGKKSKKSNSVRLGGIIYIQFYWSLSLHGKNNPKRYSAERRCWFQSVSISLILSFQAINIRLRGMVRKYGGINSLANLKTRTIRTLLCGNELHYTKHSFNGFF